MKGNSKTKILKKWRIDMTRKNESFKNSKYKNTYTNTELSTYTPTAFEKIREQFGLSTLDKKPRNPTVLKSKIEKFTERKQFECKVCGSKLEWITGTNSFACINENCKGIEKTRRDGTKYYIPVITLLNAQGQAIAETLLSKKTSEKKEKNYVNNRSVK